jgi:hypothetical protein
MREGIPVGFVGAEGSYRPERLVIPRQSITLAISAAAVLRFVQEVAPQYQNTIHPHQRTAKGESRGGMVGMGLLAMDELFEQDIVFADFTAPCIPKKLSFRDWLELGVQITKEPAAITKAVSHIALNTLIHYPATLDLHPYAVVHQVAIGKPLFSGEAGELARLIPVDTIAHVTTFKDDYASMYREWKRIFIRHPNVRITPLNGSHLTIADPETLAFILARQKAFHEAFARLGRDVTASSIFDAAHDYVGTMLEKVEK